MAWLGAATAALLVALLITLWQVSRAPCFVLAGAVTCRAETSKPVVALSFDDGPTDRGVDAALPILAGAGIRATFFLIGQEAASRPDLVRRLVSAGHEVGNHSYNHSRMVAKSAGFYDAEIRRTHEALVAAGAPAPRFFRPPYGKKLIGLPLAVKRQGYRMITWDVEDPTDIGPDAQSYANRIVAEARPGSIILMHPMYAANEQARLALPLVIDGLKARGFTIVPVGELLRRARGADAVGTASR